MEADYYDGRRRSKIVLSSDFECCHKYKHTLPDHVELLGGSESYDNLKTVSVKSKHTPSSETLRTQSIISSKSEAGSEKSKEHSDALEQADELVEETYSEVEVEMVEEEEEYESSICSEWIVLKPDKKRRKKKEVVVESSVSDLMGPAGARRLLKRPPSPEGEMYDEETRPKNLTPSNFFKYKDGEKWPEPPPMEQALLKREPSPNMSFPRSRDDLEIVGEDWLWFEGHYMESGDLEIHGEGEVYYRLPKQWKEGHWEPAPALLERWEREEWERERERQQALEERRKYEEVIKRGDSPGMDVMNWGDGPVKLTAWMKYDGPKSLKELSSTLPVSISNLLVRVASEVSPEILGELMARVDEAMMAENSLEMIKQLLDAYVTKGIDALNKEKPKGELLEDSKNLDTLNSATSFREDLKTGSSKSVRFVEETLEAAPEEPEAVDEESTANLHLVDEELGEEAEEEQVPVASRPVIKRDGPCDPIPDSFRDTLLEFIQDFVADKPGDPLVYAIGYFQSRIPRDGDSEKSLPGEFDATSQLASERRSAAIHVSSKQSDEEMTDEGEVEEYEKTPKETKILVKALNSCWVTRDLDLATMIALVKAMKLIYVEGNEEIQSSVVKPDTFYVIKKGAFKLQNQFGTKILKDRGFFGELSLNSMVAESLKAPFSAISQTRGALWCLKRTDFLRIKDSFHKNKTTILFSMMGVMELFDNLTAEEKQTVVDCLDIQFFKKKDIIFCQGSDPEGIYFFLDGMFKLIRIDQARGSAGSSAKNSVGEEFWKKQNFYHASTYSSPRLLGYGNFIERRPWSYSCVARSNIVQVAILKTDVFERLYGEPEDVLYRPPPPPPKPKPVNRMLYDSEGEMHGEVYGEYYGEYHGEELGEEAAPPPPPPKVIPWLKKKVFDDPDEPPKPKPPPSYEEIMDAMWGRKPVYQHPKDTLCMCGQCKNTVTCVGQGMKCCDKPKVHLESNK